MVSGVLCCVCFVLSYCGIRLAQVLFTDLCQPKPALETYPAIHRLSREKNEILQPQSLTQKFRNSLGGLGYKGGALQKVSGCCLF